MGLIYKVLILLCVYTKIHANIHIKPVFDVESAYSVTSGSEQNYWLFLVAERTAGIWKSRHFLPLAIFKVKDLDVDWWSLTCELTLIMRRLKAEIGNHSAPHNFKFICELRFITFTSGREACARYVSSLNHT